MIIIQLGALSLFLFSIYSFIWGNSGTGQAPLVISIMISIYCKLAYNIYTREDIDYL